MASHLPVSGQFPDFDAENQVPVLVGTLVAFAWASTILRLYVRGYVVYSLGYDDTTIASTQVCVAARPYLVPDLHERKVLLFGVSIVTILRKLLRQAPTSFIQEPARYLREAKYTLGVHVWMTSRGQHRSAEGSPDLSSAPPSLSTVTSLASEGLLRWNGPLQSFPRSSSRSPSSSSTSHLLRSHPAHTPLVLILFVGSWAITREVLVGM
ncbi:hypothetical protein VUR80DRAFT_709 [Thermomyces stellatus]